MARSFDHLSRGMSLPARMFRFAGVGALSSLAYLVAVALYVELVGIGPKSASVLAYITALPVSFLGHRKFTFRSTNDVRSEIVRFVILHMVNAGVSLAGMIGAVDWLGSSHWFGSLAAIVLVPLSTYFVMSQWIFSCRS